MAEDRKGQPNYLYAMLVSRANTYAALAAAGLATLMSIPFGFRAALIPTVLFLAGEAIAALFIPGSAGFRQAVERQHRQRRRERVRQHLLSQLKGRLPDEAAEFQAYRRMLTRIDSLRTLVADRRSTMSETDLERLEDATLDYLGLLLARALVHERLKNMDDQALENRRQQIQQRLKQADSLAERQRLQKAYTDLVHLLDNRRRLESRRLAIESALLAMPETLEEIYQNLIINPANAAGYLQSAVERLRLEEELDTVLDTELETHASDHRLPLAARMETEKIG